MENMNSDDPNQQHLSRRQKVKHHVVTYYEKNETRLAIAFFLGGFIFDIVTLSSVDDLFSITQQVVYLFIIGGCIYLDALCLHEKCVIPQKLTKIWAYRQLIVHFLLGSLLSVYSLFYFKSSSIISSFVFMAILFGLMIANEFQQVQSRGLWIKFVLWLLSLISFISIIVPTVVGSVGYFTFAISMVIVCLILYSLYKQVRKFQLPLEYLKKQLYVPAVSTVVLFILFYFLGLIPPVPLSAQFMGIYHNVEKYEDQYHLIHSNPFWKFWNNGDQEFYAKPNDKIFFFMNMYSPARFSDSVIIHWLYKNPKSGWETWDRVPMKISGGRDEGFRGFMYKSKYTEGDWRIQVETTDGREIGRIYLTVINDTSNDEPTLEKDIR